MLKLIPCILIAAASVWSGPAVSRSGESGCTSLADSAASILRDCDAPELPGGMAGAMICDGKVVFKGAVGWADYEHRVPFTTSTRFDFASVAKQFAGLAVAMLVVDGRIDLDADIRSYLPEMPVFDHVITVRHLVHHQSGLRDELVLLQIAGRRWQDIIDPAIMWRYTTAQSGLNFTPGEKYSYTNIGYFLLAEIVARVTGQSFPEWTGENIFRPLGMTDTLFLGATQEIVEGLASSYLRARDGTYRYEPNNLASYGSSSLISTVDDMVKWVRNLETGVVGGPEALALMHREGVLNSGEAHGYGFGVQVIHCGDLDVYEHAGDWAGYTCKVVWVPERRFAFFTMSSRGYEDGNLADRWRELLCGEDCREPVSVSPVRSDSTSVTIEASAAELSRCAGVFDGIISGNRIFRTFEVSPDSGLVYRGVTVSHPLRKVGRNLFRLDRYDAEVEFVFPADGAPRSVVMRGGSWESESTWLADRRPPADVPTAYSGRYWCEDLQMVLDVRAEADRLVAWNLQHGAMELSWLFGDIFLVHEHFVAQVEFTRDTDDNVAGIAMTGNNGRVVGLSFVRMH